MTENKKRAKKKRDSIKSSRIHDIYNMLCIIHATCNTCVFVYNMLHIIHDIYFLNYVIQK